MAIPAIAMNAQAEQGVNVIAVMDELKAAMSELNDWTTKASRFGNDTNVRRNHLYQSLNGT